MATAAIHEPNARPTSNPWELAKSHPTLLSYTLVGMRDELASIAECQSTITSELQALETLKDRSWRRTKLGRRFISSVSKQLQAEQEQLAQRRAEITRWLPELEAHYVVEYATRGAEASWLEDSRQQVITS